MFSDSEMVVIEEKLNLIESSFKHIIILMLSFKFSLIYDYFYTDEFSDIIKNYFELLQLIILSLLNSLINFPLENLDLSRYVCGYNNDSYKYDLYGICNHMGGVMGGHYTAFVRNSDNNWLHYNDRNVDMIQKPESVITPMAYCLFYRKKNNLL
jgi:hypothetical protein